MFLRIVILSISILLSPIAKSMDSNKGIFALGTGILAATVGSFAWVANKYKRVCIGDRPYEGPCTTDWAASKTWKVTDHHQKAIPIVSFHPETVSDPFSTIMQTIKPSLWEYLTGNGTYKPIDNLVLTQLKQSNFSVIIAALVHRQDTPDHSDQLHIFNINNKYIVRTWCKKDVFNPEDLNSVLSIINNPEQEHTCIQINSDSDHYLFVTTLGAEKHMESGYKQTLKKETNPLEKILLQGVKMVYKDFNIKTFNLLLKSTIENSENTSDAFKTLNVFAKKSKETVSSGAKMLLHIKK